jgi:superfamily II DNA or RNA helicase
MEEKIHFLDYRKKPIEHLVARCKTQHGLILNHTMGTGKTLTAALFLANFSQPPFKHMVIAPKSTFGEWMESVEKVGQSNPKNLNLVSLDKETIFSLNETYADSKAFIVIVDEAHNLMKMITDPNVALAVKKKTFSWFSKCKKLLLLTGTPFSSAVEDISHIINMAAGKIVMPTAFHEFQKKYYTLSKKKAVMLGWVLPSMTTALEFMLKWSAPIILVFIGSTVITGRAQDLSYWELAKFVSKSHMHKNTWTEEYIREFVARHAPSALVGVLTKFMFFLRNLLSVLISAPGAIVVYIAFSFLYYLIIKVQKSNNIFDLNVANITKDIGPYISTYDPFSIPNDPIRENFPIGIERIQYTIMNRQQMKALYKIMTGKLSELDLVSMGIVSSPEELDFYRVSKTYEFYLDIGRLASSSGTSPAKFTSIFAMHKKEKVPTLIYSNLEGGVSLFLSHARKAGFVCEMIPTESSKEKELLIEAAQKGTIDFLCLPHYAMEGTNVPKMRRFHILEPCLDIVVYRQLIARVIRYNPEVQSYIVEIYTWVAKMPEDYTRTLNFFDFWTEFGLHEAPWIFAQKIEHDLSPEILAIENLRKMSKTFYSIQADLMRLSTSNTSVVGELSCCVYNPNEPCDKKESCLAVYKKEMK